eukprot:114597-Pelagomonas_calceolata.AAC.1
MGVRASCFTIAKKLAHALQVWPRLLLFVCVLLTPTCLRAASGAVTPEHEARAQKLLQDNLRPTLAFWENLRAAHGGRKLSMQSFFKLVHANIGSRFTGVWGIKNNKVHSAAKMEYTCSFHVLMSKSWAI